MRNSGVGRPSVALFDFDLWTYDVAFAAQPRGSERSLNFDYCQKLIDDRFEEIMQKIGCSTYEGYLTGVGNFRHDIAEVLPYKGNRKQPRPWHYENIRNYLKFKYAVQVVDGIEADDILAVRAKQLGTDACIVSRDKDLRIVPCWHYGYPVGRQPESPLEFIDELGYLTLSDKGKLFGGGLRFFYAQMIMGDSSDNIPGLPKGGPVLAYNTLKDLETEEELFKAVRDLYVERLPEEEAYPRLLEMGRLLWMVNELDNDGNPVMWEPPKLIQEEV